ncbi:hypothetical protein BCR43DRAFT_484490 [Syncephalastrum racemosum]|uniref:Uncharacterized protein n=1 Tax=Syncephalastrum racemosum TaxID=13706 RepID=A0A1X2HKU2_SYNRA|nr:hypothetical protein BCR43DRAFT_484490 [Syncephalastrum racemosum]
MISWWCLVSPFAEDTVNFNGSVAAGSAQDGYFLLIFILIIADTCMKESLIGFT